MTTPQPTEEQIQSALAWINGEMTPERKVVLMKEPYPSTNESQLRFRVMKILAAALAASRRDAERLDWIHNNSRRRAGGDSVIHEFTTPYPDDHTIRAAIDAAEKGAAG